MKEFITGCVYRPIGLSPKSKLDLNSTYVAKMCTGCVKLVDSALHNKKNKSCVHGIKKEVEEVEELINQ